jgi:hypothetical protein
MATRKTFAPPLSFHQKTTNVHHTVFIMISKDKSRDTNLNNSLNLRSANDLARKKNAVQYLLPA